MESTKALSCAVCGCHFKDSEQDCPNCHSIHAPQEVSATEVPLAAIPPFTVFLAVYFLIEFLNICGAISVCDDGRWGETNGYIWFLVSRLPIFLFLCIGHWRIARKNPKASSPLTVVFIGINGFLLFLIAMLIVGITSH